MDQKKLFVKLLHSLCKNSLIAFHSLEESLITFMAKNKNLSQLYFEDPLHGKDL